MWVVAVAVALLVAQQAAGKTTVSSGEHRNSLEPGSQRTYSYSTVTSVGGFKATGSYRFIALPIDIAYLSLFQQIVADVHVAVVWQSPDSDQALWEIRPVDWRLNGAARFSDKEKSVLEQSLWILFDRTSLVEAFSAAGHDDVDNVEATNLKRGIASLFKAKTTWKGRESDVLGICQSEYSKDQAGIHVTKTDCMRKEELSSSKRLFGVSVTKEYLGTFRFEGDVLESARTHMVINERINAKKNNRWTVNVEQELKLRTLEDVLNSDATFEASSVSDVKMRIEKKMSCELTTIDIVSQSMAPTIQKPGKFKTLISSQKRKLQPSSFASEDAPKTFAYILDQAKRVSRKDFLEVLKDKKNRDLLPYLMDVLGATSTQSAHDAAMEFVAAKQGPLLERYLWAVSQCAHPEVYVVEDLLNRLKGSTSSEDSGLSRNCKETLMLTLATLSTKFEPQSEISRQILTHFFDGLAQCKKESCQLLYLRTFRNLKGGYSMTSEDQARYVHTLLTFLKQGTDKTGLLAAQNLGYVSPHLYPSDIGVVFLTVFGDLTADSSLRVLCAELLLQQELTPQVFRHILTILSSSSREIVAYTLNRMQELRHKSASLDQLIRTHLTSGHFSWPLLWHGGLSSSFSHDLVTSADTGNLSYSFAFEMSGTIFKRSSFNLMLQEDENEQSIMQLNLFAHGLSGMFGSSKSSSKKEEEMTAGMELQILETSLRPFHFFHSMADIMNMYWSGKLGQKNSALQANQMLQDITGSIALSNGLFLKSTIMGCVSYDFSGKAEVSIWDRTSQSLVENALSYLLVSQFSISLFQSDILTGSDEWSTKLALNLETDIDVADTEKIKSCVRVVLPDFKSRSAKFVSDGGDPSASKKQEDTTTFQGQTLYLNPKNNELCNKMNKPPDEAKKSFLWG